MELEDRGHQQVREREVIGTPGRGGAVARAPGYIDKAGKEYFQGTHRTRAPEVTWRWISEILPRVGVTRVADVTGLDRLGIPVWQAIRPASRNLTVSQGKALTAAGARVSAAMESIELWHAESLDRVPQAALTLRELESGNSINSDAFHWRADSRLLEAARIPWLRAKSLTRDRYGWLPRQMLELDFTLPSSFAPRMFHLSSNGLASGNCLEEALLHALCELIERHAIYLARHDKKKRMTLSEESIDSEYCLDLIQRMRGAGMKLSLYDVTWEVDVPCVVADLVAPDLPNVWGGWGCHTSSEVALSRALTEAAQSRLTYISGARDDLHPFREKANLSRTFYAFSEPAAERRFADLPTRSTASVGGDLQLVLESLERLGYEPYFVDLSRDEIGVPVVFAFVPGLRDAPYA